MSSNNGIGYKGNLPWNLKKELQHFSRLTKEVKNLEKKNAVIMGRKTWESLPKNWQPLPGRFNFVLSRQPLKFKKICENTVHCTSLEDVILKLKSEEYVRQIETAWIIGGSQVYETALKKNICHRIYLTRILKDFECDTFLHYDFSKGFKKILDNRVPEEIQEENNIQYVFHVLEKDL